MWRWRFLILAYLLLLAVSQVVTRLAGRQADPTPGQSVLTVRAVEGERLTKQPVQIAYWDLHPQDRAGPDTILLVHGSPMQTFDLEPLARELAHTHRVITPDLPGFGRSTRRVPDYSMRAHAIYLRQLIAALQLDRIHVVAYSMGGGVALHLGYDAPERVQSLSLISSIGAQEFELLGDYRLNHALHGIQLACFWFAQNMLPHMGLMDRAMLNWTYARNFYDSDQRPLRNLLTQWEKPMLIVHGNDDPLVPTAAAKEHARLVPQSELVLLEGGHLLVFRNAPLVAQPILAFLDRCAQGLAVSRAQADPQRVAAAGPTNASLDRKATGIALLIIILLIAAATLFSEDLACIGAGLLVAQGVMDFFSAAFASFLGIFVGDMLLYFAGRYIGRPALRHRPLKWIVRDDAIQESAKWFSEKGPVVIVLSRFVPGSRLPTYFTAGMLRANFWRFTLLFLAAGVVWAPLLVWLAAVLGRELLDFLEAYRFYTIVTLLLTAFVIWLVVELIIPLFTFRGRRLLLGKWRRRARWEFWPLWFFYPPVIAYLLYLSLKHRSLTAFTACNPAIPAGGFIGESKSAILNGLAGAAQFLARYRVMEPTPNAQANVDAVKSFMQDEKLGWPIVLKPDVGQRGRGVAIIRSEEELAAYFARPRPVTILQEYIPGHEFGVFYYRYPDQPRGRIYSIVHKLFPCVIGDGESDMERLILMDPRAVCMARKYMTFNQERLGWIPAKGQSVQLIEVGSHCRGAVFQDGTRHITPALEEAMDAISRSFDGFYFGRYDVRAESMDDFYQGRNFKIIELNGVTAEATHIYSSEFTLRAAYRSLMTQWRIAYEIGSMNRARGVPSVSLADLARALIHYRPPAEAK